MTDSPANRVPRDSWGEARGNSYQEAEQGTAQDASPDAFEISLRIAAPAQRVFQLLTDPERIGLWFAQVAGIEPHVGGAVEFAFFNDNGSVSVFSGEVCEFVPYSRFSFTWHYQDWSFQPLHVLFNLRDIDNATELALRLTGLAAAPPIERDIHEEGWHRYLARLAAVADGTRPAGWNA